MLLFLGLISMATAAVKGADAQAMTLTVTADESVEMFVNGQYRNLQNGGDVNQVDVVMLTPSDRLIAFHAQGNGWCSGILAGTEDEELITQDDSFRCTGNFYPGWMNLGFDETSSGDWYYAYTVGYNDGTGSSVCPSWVAINEISPNAHWIWTANQTDQVEDLDMEIYCRGYLPVCLPNPCENDGYCDPNGIDSICDCPPGYTGQFCETHLVQPCGDILQHAADLPVPESWDLYCYITTEDDRHSDDPCEDLLLGIPGYGNSTALLEAGGNFGCWVMHTYPDPNALNACVDNYQHDRSLASCFNCSIMGVCIRLPQQ